MSGNPRPPADVENALAALARTIELPAPPDYADRVLQQLADEASRSAAGVRRRWTSLPSGGVSKLLVAAVLILLTAAVALVVPASRQAIASWFGFSGIDIRTAPHRTSPLPSGPAPLAAGSRISLQEARAATADRVELPDGLQQPDRVFLRRDDRAVIVTIAYLAAGRLEQTHDTGYALIVTEIFDAGSPLLEKVLHTGARTTSVEVNGRPGVFVAGPQEIINLERTQTTNGMQVVHEVAPRASANTLIWSDAAGTYRLEGDFTRQVAVDLARSFR